MVKKVCSRSERRWDTAYGGALMVLFFAGFWSRTWMMDTVRVGGIDVGNA